MLIRRYRPQDNEAVKALHYAGLAQFGAMADPYHDRDLDDIEGTYLNGGEFLVGFLDEKLVVMGALKKLSEGRAEIKRIRVRRDYQRRGYGEMILSRLIEIASSKGYQELCLDSVVDNIPAIRLFEKCGFTETRRGKVGGFDLVFYGKEISQT
jgi:ribosomal protein S18 acetylase RimI-like enzyme